MRLLAAAAVLVAGVAVAGCGAQSAVGPTAVTINLPAVVAQAPAATNGSVAAGSRRIFGHPSAGRSAASSSSAGVSGAGSSSTGASSVGSSGAGASGAGTGATSRVAPLTPAANARLNGVSLWIPYWNLTAATDDAIANAAVVKVAHPFTDEITGTATVVDQSDGAGATATQQLADAHITVIPTVTETADMAEFAATLASPRTQAALVKSLVAIAEAPGDSGVDLDFENMAIGTGNIRQAAQVAKLYPRFVARLCATLHQGGRSCEVTVMAKNTPGLQDSDGLNTGVYDYRALGQVADRVQVMAYDDHVPSGAAGPVAPWPWVESVLDYALEQIPAAKLVLGVPAYGYQWNAEGHNSSLTATGAESLAAEVHAPIRWNATDAEPYFTWTTDTTTQQRFTVRKHVTRTVRSGLSTRRVTQTVTLTRVRTLKHPHAHVVWFEDSTADYDRAVLAADDHLAGIALWTGADESPGLWTLLKRITHY